ncbi:DUF4082 domain-containing protein [Epilithonimonas sp. JDS]|uniref:DUF4082 domain-containing protein n=1 Tax=Epilithonimonas sp. JDS TaxID=2902797 RepID=UPI001E4879B8|nr:DUF4082 domain-containing protein [Epilithonimonas sp. JDS]MCD9854458.1 DUF4082 domain-containing protein [Epilithonimonas sp. JDS]
MKTLKIILLLLLITGLITCRKEDDNDNLKTYPEENPLALYLEKSGFNQKTTPFIDSVTYELGYKFKAKVKGKINAVTFKIPDNAANVRVTIWDVSTKGILRTFYIPVTTANTEVRSAIDPMTVNPDTEYLITYSGNVYYFRQKTDGTNTVYPIDAGNITITGYHWRNGTAQIFPEQMAAYYYTGDLSIVFQQAE